MLAFFIKRDFNHRTSWKQEKSLRDGVSIGKNLLVYKTVLKLTPLMEIPERIRSENTTT